MDENGIFNPEISSKNYYLLFIKRALQLLLPVSLASFLLSSTNFPIFFTSYFNYYFTTLVFPFLTHVLERKYMFLICNGILAFLVKTLNFSNPNPNSSSSVLDAEDGFGSDSSLNMNIPPLSGQVDPTQPESSPQADVNIIIAPDPEEEEGKKEEEEEHPSPETEDAFADDDVVQGEPESDQGGDFIIESDEYLQMDMDDEDQEEEEEMMEELAGGGALGEQEMEVNMNTEELNKKFEEFIRKMKEELRIQEQHQLIAV